MLNCPASRGCGCGQLLARPAPSQAMCPTFVCVRLSAHEGAFRPPSRAHIISRSPHPLSSLLVAHIALLCFVLCPPSHFATATVCAYCVPNQMSLHRCAYTLLSRHTRTSSTAQARVHCCHSYRCWGQLLSAPQPALQSSARSKTAGLPAMHEWPPLSTPLAPQAARRALQSAAHCTADQNPFYQRKGGACKHTHRHTRARAINVHGQWTAGVTAARTAGGTRQLTHPTSASKQACARLLASGLQPSNSQTHACTHT